MDDEGWLVGLTPANDAEKKPRHRQHYPQGDEAARDLDRALLRAREGEALSVDGKKHVDGIAQRAGR